MKNYTTEDLKNMGYDICNGIITGIDLSIDEHYEVFTLKLFIKFKDGTVLYDSGNIGTRDSYANTYKPYPYGIEYIMRIMDVIGVHNFNDAKGKYIRLALLDYGVKLIGNIIDDNMWFDSKSFFEDLKNKEEE